MLVLKQQNRYLWVIIVRGYFSVIRSFTWLNYPSESISYHKTSLSVRFDCWHLSGIPLFPLHFTVYGSFSDNFNFSMKKASRAYNFCFISKRHVVFRWQSVGQINTRLNAKKYKKDWNKFIFWLFKCLKFLPSQFTVLGTHSITCIILPLSNIIICFKLSYPWKQTTE